MLIERDAASDRPEAALVRLGPSGSPLAGRGLDEIGLFAYSRDEVEDRIYLIDQASSDGVPDRDANALRSARHKLDSWRSTLDL